MPYTPGQRILMYLASRAVSAPGPVPTQHLERDLGLDVVSLRRGIAELESQGVIDVQGESDRLPMRLELRVPPIAGLDAAGSAAG